MLVIINYSRIPAWQAWYSGIPDNRNQLDFSKETVHIRKGYPNKSGNYCLNPNMSARPLAGS